MTDITLGEHIKFPAYGEKSISSQVIFITGKRGSGKSYTAGVLMEELERCKLQFVCFDVLSAHLGMDALPNVESISPREDETIDMNLLISKIANGNKSLIIDVGNCTLPKQQLLISDYCEALINAKIGLTHHKTLMTIFEECQDFVPQQGKPISFNSIVRLCKLGRGLGYGTTLITQRPAACNKEALSQAAVYLTHNVINSRDLKALEEQLSFGTDRERVKRILQGVNAAQLGEVVAYAPEYFRESGYIRIGKIRGDRRTKHSGGNIPATPVGESGTNVSHAEGTHLTASTGLAGQNNMAFSDTAIPSHLATIAPLSGLSGEAGFVANNMGFTPFDPYSESDMGTDGSYLASEELDGAFHSEESPDTMLSWAPPELDYAGLEDNGFLAEESKPLARGPLFGFSVAIMIAGGAFFMLKA
jgi:hypothetical protein